MKKNPAKKLLREVTDTKLAELKDYAFKRIRDPKRDKITEDSLRNALNQNDIKNVDDDVLE